MLKRIVFFLFALAYLSIYFCMQFFGYAKKTFFFSSVLLKIFIKPDLLIVYRYPLALLFFIFIIVSLLVLFRYHPVARLLFKNLWRLFIERKYVLLSLLFLWIIMISFDLYTVVFTGKTKWRVLMMQGFAIDISGFLSLVFLMAANPLKFIFENTFEKTRSFFFSSSRKNFLLRLYIIYFVFSLFISIFIFKQMPRIEDEISYLLQARIFASGKFHLGSFPFADAINYYWIYTAEKVYSTFTPGWPLILSIGAFLKAPWLTNIIISAITLFFIYRLGALLYNERTARLAAILAVFSPWFIFMTPSFMSHPSCMLMILIAYFCYFNYKDRNVLLSTLIPGLLTGYAYLIRPLSGIVMGIPLLYLIIKQFKKKTILDLLLFLAGPCIALAFTMYYNYNQTGDPLLFPVSKYTKIYFGHEINSLGFSSESGLWATYGSYGHSINKAISNTMHNLRGLNHDLFSWGIPGLLFILIYFIYNKLKETDYVLLAGCLIYVFAYSWYFFYGGTNWSARFYFELVPFIFIFSAAGLFTLLENTLWIDVLKGFNIRLVKIMLVTGFILILPVSGFALLERHSQNLHGIGDKLYKDLKKNKIDNGLVFVIPYDQKTYGLVWYSVYGPGFLLNDLEFKNKLLFVKQQNEKRDYEVSQYFKNYKVYIYQPNQVAQIYHPDFDYSYFKPYSPDPNASVIPRNIKHTEKTIKNVMRPDLEEED
ncbi:MAG: glycosyltransferase family 39 protein [Candidatus Coatesbacteria bacterium]|nr:glycosyltransferase family 39 protein [Candidatus Coatesbacteria bacterium]